MTQRFTIPARKGKATFVEQGQSVRVINTHGSQVVDTWAFARHDQNEFMSMEHTRSTLGKMIPALGDPFHSNRRRPILSLTEDTSPGIHDTLCAACDIYRYMGLGWHHLPRQLHRQPGGVPVRDRGCRAGDPRPPQSVYEYSLVGGKRGARV